MKVRRTFAALALFAAGLMLSLSNPLTLYAGPPVRPLLDTLPNCTGTYYNNITLSGAIALTRTDALLDFVWGEGVSPGAGVNTNNYSVRWTCPITVPTSGTYTLNAVTDDGMNVLVDGSLVLWAWYDQGPTSYSTTGSLSAGAHTVTVQYYNRDNAGTAHVSISLPGSSVSSYPDWKGEYFANQTLAGSPTVTRNDTSINFDWGVGTPDGSLPVDHFSARWTRTLYLSAGTYEFSTTTDDGVRLWVDGSLLIDRWVDQSTTTWSNTIALAAGNHTLRMEYYDDTWYAVAKLSYGPVAAPAGAWYGQYFNNTTLSGSPLFTRYDNPLDFNWGVGSPGGGMPADDFSVSWDSTQNFPTAGNFTLTVTADDGVRVWYDAGIVINKWFDQAPTTYTFTAFAGAGMHTFRVEYYEHTGGAQIKVQISTTGGGAGDVVVDDAAPGWQAGGCYYCWHVSPAGVGAHSFWTFNNTYAVYGYNWARWNVSLPQSRLYEVFAYIPAGVGNTSNARYWISHAGYYNLVARNQGLYANQWVSLGTYWFSAGAGQYVSLSDVTGECYLCRTMVFDAVKFSPR